MLKNITLSAEEKLIERARKKAESKNTTLNAEFRRWLDQYVDVPQSMEELNEFMKQFDYVKVGRKFTREELNER
jgi:sugar/nucleoside kinase (ribokinase family)